MKSKYLYWLGCFCGFVLVFAVAAFLYLQYHEGRNVRGQYTFVHTRQNINRLSKITLISRDSGEMNIVRQGDTWIFKEANDYFANVEMLAEFYKMVNNSIILTVDDETAPEKYGLQLNTKGVPEYAIIVRTYDDNGDLLDDIVLSKIYDDKRNRYARLTNRPYVYTVNNAARFSGMAESWLPYPLLNIRPETIDSLEWHDTFYNHQNFENLLQTSAEGREVVRSLQFVEYQGLVPVMDFIKAYPQARAQNIRVITTVGLVYDMQVFYVENSYWLRVVLASAKIARKAVPDFIRNNQKYFDRWLFQLTDEQGALLYHTTLPTVRR